MSKKSAVPSHRCLDVHLPQTFWAPKRPFSPSWTSLVRDQLKSSKALPTASEIPILCVSSAIFSASDMDSSLFRSEERPSADATPVVRVQDEIGPQVRDSSSGVSSRKDSPADITSSPKVAAHTERIVTPEGASHCSSTASSPPAYARSSQGNALRSPLLQLPPAALNRSRTESSHSGLSGYSKRRMRIWTPREYNHWKSPVLMVLLYITGLVLSVAHCVFYKNLDGKIVGSSYDQEQNLRYDPGSLSPFPCSFELPF